MWQFIMSLIGGPVVSGLLNAYQAHLKATTTDEKIAMDLAGKEIAAQVAEVQVQNDLKKAEIGHFFEPEKIAFYIALVFYAKCVIWDTVLGWGVTPPLKGDVSLWSGMIFSYYFAKRSMENVFRIIKR